MTRDFDDQSQDFIDEQLDQLIAEAGQHPERSLGRQRPLRIILNSVALRGRLFDRVIEESDRNKRSREKNRFLFVMKGSGKKLWIPRWTSNWATEEDRADMCSEVDLWFCKNFDSYVPEKACPITWCNRKLRFISIDYYKFLYKSAPPPLPLDQLIGNSDDGGSTFGDLLPSPDPDPFALAEDGNLCERVRTCLEKPVFINTCISEDHQNIHCRSLLSDFLLNEMEWGEIYEKYGVAQDKKLRGKIRRCYRERCLPRLRDCLSDK